MSCPTCDGTGAITEEMTCPDCLGLGLTYEELEEVFGNANELPELDV